MTWASSLVTLSSPSIVILIGLAHRSSSYVSVSGLFPLVTSDGLVFSSDSISSWFEVGMSFSGPLSSLVTSSMTVSSSDENSSWIGRGGALSTSAFPLVSASVAVSSLVLSSTWCTKAGTSVFVSEVSLASNSTSLFWLDASSSSFAVAALLLVGSSLLMLREKWENHDLYMKRYLRYFNMTLCALSKNKETTITRLNHRMVVYSKLTH